ncbi:hypothetical protein FRB94_013013 [Tulasnella sp. JGI-2019a]|nr:hypothetical protein FRB94_013013 [Tulasnella sp. JGI-2019a]KAG9008159.1 hypothetical protein FRB93_006726 [Tulasnella sp. JGI-2019a]
MPDVSSPAPLEDLEFWGHPNDDVSRFLGAVLRIALIQGRHSDKQWMFVYTESCLRGDALEWFDNMSADVARMEWSSLRKAFIRRFHRPDSYMASPPPTAEATEAAVAATEVVVKMATAAVQKAEAAAAAASEAAAATATATKNAEAATASATKAAVAVTKKAGATVAAAREAVVAAATETAASAREAVMTATAAKEIAMEAKMEVAVAAKDASVAADVAVVMANKVEVELAAATERAVAAAKEAAVMAAKEAMGSLSHCRVKVVRVNGQSLGYIPPPDRSSASFLPVSSENALVLDIPKVCYTNQTLARIRMVAQSEAYPFLGLEEHNVILWMLRACKAGWEPHSGKRTWVDSEYGEQSASSTIWTVKTLDDSTEELCAVWIDDTGGAFRRFTA